MRDDRAVSTTLSQVFVVGITAVLVSGLVVAAGGAVEEQRDRTARQELKTIGERVATNVQQVDRLATRPNTTVSMQTSHPRSVVGGRYDIALRTDGDCPTGVSACVRLYAPGPGVEAVVPVSNVTAVESSEVAGGSLTVRYDGTAVSLEAER
jgi:hypothetical protein